MNSFTDRVEEAEEDRTVAERGRVAAEEARDTAEKNRVTAEENRAKAESERENHIKKLLFWNCVYSFICISTLIGIAFTLYKLHAINTLEEKVNTRIEKLEETINTRIETLEETIGKWKTMLPQDKIAFVNHMYSVILDRNPEPEGHREWVEAASNGTSPEKLILNIVSSDEFKERKLSNREYLEIIYKATQGIDPKDVDINGYLEKLNEIDDADKLEEEKLDVLEYYLRSPGFKKVCESYGIQTK